MYKIIGADGKEYGPVSQIQLRQWLNEGRVNRQTKVLPDGATTWLTLAELPEFLSAEIPAAPPAFTNASIHSEAKDKVRAPAICAIVLAAINLVWCPVRLMLNALDLSMIDSSTMPEESVAIVKKFSALFGLPISLLGGVLALVCLFGAISMLRLRSYGFAMASAIIMLFPCGNCCCLLNIGFGIWALVVLSKPEVKAAFQ